MYDFESPNGYIVVNDLLISNCGAIATQAVCEFFGVGPETEEAYIRDLGTTPENGTPVHNIIAFLTKHGLDVQAKNGMTIEELKAFLDKGAPVICLVQAWGDDWENYVQEVN